MANQWITIKIPKELADKIDELINSKYFGYKNRGQFVSEKIRIALQEIERLKRTEDNGNK